MRKKPDERESNGRKKIICFIHDRLLEKIRRVTQIYSSVPPTQGIICGHAGYQSNFMLIEVAPLKRFVNFFLITKI